MGKIRKIIQLHSQGGMSQRMIAQAVRVSRPVVAQYLALYRKSGLQLSQVEAMSDTELEARLQPGNAPTDPRYAQFAQLLSKITQELGRQGVTRQLLWEEYRSEHPEGYSYTQFCFHVQTFAETGELAMHLEHEGGRELFLDFAGYKPTYYEQGIQRAAELFVSVFPAGGLIYCEVTESQAIEHFVAASRHTLEYGGGSPVILVPDNLKSGVDKANRYEPKINETFEDFAEYYGSVVVPARVRRPRDKALVEAAVNLVYQRVLAPLRNRVFQSLEELNEAMGEKLEALNNRPMQRTSVSRWDRFRSVDLPTLKRLPDKPYELREFHRATVAFNYHIYFSPDKHYYSVPWTLRRKKVRLVSNATTVEIYYNNRRVATHRRDRRAGQYSTQHEHMPKNHRMYAEWSPERFLRWARTFGPNTEALISKVLAARSVPEQAYRSCLGILSLAKQYGSPRLEAAATRALRYNVFSYASMQSILKKRLDQQTEEPKPFVLPEHENIRGGAYYEPDGEGEAQ